MAAHLAIDSGKLELIELAERIKDNLGLYSAYAKEGAHGLAACSHRKRYTFAKQYRF